MHFSKLLNNHIYTQNVTWKPIWEKTTRCSSFGIGMRKQMHLLSIHKATNSVQYILFYHYRLLSPLMLYILLYLYHSTLLLLNDPHTSWINSTFSICLHPQMQIHYSNALNDPESLTQNYCILYLVQKASKQELANRLLIDQLTHVQLVFLLLQHYYRLDILPYMHVTDSIMT